MTKQVIKWSHQLDADGHLMIQIDSVCIGGQRSFIVGVPIFLSQAGARQVAQELLALLEKGEPQ